MSFVGISGKGFFLNRFRFDKVLAKSSVANFKGAILFGPLCIGSDESGPSAYIGRMIL